MEAHKLTYKVLEGEVANQLKSLFPCMSGAFGDMVSLDMEFCIHF